MKICLVLFSLLILSNCGKNPPCKGGQANEGIIERSIDPPCLPNNGKTFVINDDSTYRNTFRADCSLPAIDFNTYTLLGNYASGACEVKYNRNVTRLDAEKNYHYKVSATSCGLCKSLGFSYNLVLVPKLPDQWTVSFEVEEL